MQLNLKSQETGWGDLAEELENLKVFDKATSELETKANVDRDTVCLAINKLNLKRRERVIHLLHTEGRVICLCHRLVFGKEISIDQCIVPAEKAKVINMNKSWTVTYGCYDSDKEYRTKNSTYATVACELCRGVLSRSVITDKGWNEHSLSRTRNMVPPEIKIEDLCGGSILLDEVSEKYFLMPVLRPDSIQST